MSDNIQRRQAVETALQAFANVPLPKASAKLLNSLGYASEKTTDLGGSVESLLGNIEQFKPELGKISRNKVKADRWKSCAFLFQLTNDEITSLPLPSPAGVRGAGGEGVARSQIESFVFLAIELQGESWSRTDLAAIVRELNHRFPMPAIVIFKHGLPSPAGGRGAGGEGISLAVIDRRANLKDATKDVIDSRITVIKDVRVANPHRAHLDILAGLALENLGDKRRPTNFRELYDAWIEALSTQALNKRFYQELANWYFWALTQAQFPKDAPKDADGRDSLSLIRLITRIIFCWFLKEKGLLPNALFDPRIATLLGDYIPSESTYYKAILQNLFFATLNQEMDKREFRKAGQNFMAHNLYRYRSLMKNPDEVLKLLAGIPFMNGGLFECLDKTLGTREKPTYVRIDGFSDRDDNPLKIPNELFFGDERVVDLSGAYGDNKFKSAKVAGLIHILDRYKFTVAENTPIEEEVALDPELLGKAFENLLAAYNPETGATARKQTGSFYTPREIVNYMVDESLIASLKTKLEAAPVGRVSPLGRNPTSNIPAHDDVGLRDEAANPTYNTESRLRHLFAYNDQPHQFTATEVETLIEAIDHLKILDPACGSGAFPMGVLHKLVFVLGKLDPGNQFWKARQLAKASEIPDATVRERVMDDIEQTFGANELDYGRKLYLIENCIYGVDIQPIAVQISKLRFFISLVVEQNINPQADNIGIRPLPNLETKFVAANTLIGINRPGQQLLRNLDIDVKEAELRNVRERHFLARTPATKAKCREQDATLRAEIAELLKSDGWNTATACALAEWNPYDQNASADFFDLEWMFGMMEGFDVVIGNPPYRGGREWKEEEGNFYEYFSKQYAVAEYQFDIYALFWEQAIKLAATYGVVAFITPNTWLNNQSSGKLRAYILKNTQVQSILDCSRENIFANVVVLPIITILRKVTNSTDTVKILQPSGDRFVVSNEVSQSLWNEDELKIFNIFLRAEDVAVRRRIESVSVPLEKLAVVKFGIKLYETGKGNPPQTPSDAKNHVFEAETQESPEHRKYLEGKDIDRFNISWRQRWLKYGQNLAAPREPSLFIGTRLLFRRIVGNRLIGAYCDSDYVTSQLLQIVKPFESAKAKSLLAVLNSSLMAYYFRKKYNRQDKTFPEIRIYELASLPIPKDIPQISKERIDTLVDLISETKRKSENSDTSELEDTIDREVFALYGLTPEQIKIVEEAAPSPSPRKQTTQEIESKP